MVKNRDEWMAFLRHLVEEELFSSRGLLEVIEKPHRWEDEFERFKRGESIDGDCFDCGTSHCRELPTCEASFR